MTDSYQEIGQLNLPAKTILYNMTPLYNYFGRYFKSEQNSTNSMVLTLYICPKFWSNIKVVDLSMLERKKKWKLYTS